MGIGNRTETQTNVTSKIAATVTVAKHTDVLNNDILDSVVFREDVIVAPLGISGVYVFDCEAYDQVTMGVIGNMTISFTGLQDGDIAKKVIVNKPAASTVDFSGVTGTLDGQQIGKTSLHYSVWSANSKIYVTQLNRQSSGAISIGDITNIAPYTVDSVTWFDYVINDNVCNISAVVAITDSVGGNNDYEFKITGRQFGTLKQSGYTGTARLVKSGSLTPAIMTIGDDGTDYTFKCEITDGTTTVIASSVSISFDINFTIT